MAAGAFSGITSGSWRELMGDAVGSRPRHFPNPEGEFAGWSEVSLAQKKAGVRRKRRMPPTAGSRIIQVSCPSDDKIDR